jgi:hypothetical protein
MATDNDQILEALNEISGKLSTRAYITQQGVQLNGVVAVGASVPLRTADKGYAIWVIRASGVTTGGVVLIQGCEKNSATATDWYTIATVSVTANGSYYAMVPLGEIHEYQRSNLSVRTDGTYSTFVGTIPLSAVV